MLDLQPAYCKEFAEKGNNMFYYIDGIVTVIDENLAVLDCGGVGYACSTTAYTLSHLQLGVKHKLFTYCHIREDAFDIYGFSSKEELTCFNQLLSVSGVGPKAALSILSAVTPRQLSLAIMTGDEKTLTRAQGVGKKMAQRILLELKDKIGGQISQQDVVSGSTVPVASGSKLSEATAALASLGYSNSEIGLALKNINIERMSLEEIVRCALRAMVMK